jgi:hypothetical protein
MLLGKESLKKAISHDDVLGFGREIVEIRHIRLKLFHMKDR